MLRQEVAFHDAHGPGILADMFAEDLPAIRDAAGLKVCEKSVKYACFNFQGESLMAAGRAVSVYQCVDVGVRHQPVLQLESHPGATVLLVLMTDDAVALASAGHGLSCPARCRSHSRLFELPTN